MRTPDTPRTDTPTVAEQVRDALWAAAPREPAGGTDDPVEQLIDALSTGRPRGFDMGVAVVVTGEAIEPRVWVRADGRTWSLTTLEAMAGAIRFRLAAFRAADRIADALAHAVRLAERRMDELLIRRGAA